MMKSLKGELKPSEELKWEMEKRWGKILSLDGVKMSPFHPVLIIIGHAECWMLQEWVHEGKDAPLLIG